MTISAIVTEGFSPGGSGRSLLVTGGYLLSVGAVTYVARGGSGGTDHEDRRRRRLDTVRRLARRRKRLREQEEKRRRARPELVPAALVAQQAVEADLAQASAIETLDAIASLLTSAIAAERLRAERDDEDVLILAMLAA